MKRISSISIVLISFLSTSFAQSDPYSARRGKIYEQIGADVAILVNQGRDYTRSGSINWNYYYLCGDQTEGATLVLNGAEKKATIYREQRPYGPVADSLPGLYSGDVSKMANELRRTLVRADQIWIELTQPEVLVEIKSSLGRTSGIKNISPILDNMRSIKDKYELDLLMKAGSITANGLNEVMKAAEPGMNEKDFELILDYSFKKAGSNGLGFGIQAASGPNSTSVHYGANDRKTNHGDMIVFDVGARYENYTADISRSFPVSGKFNKEQREIYQLVLDAQKAAIEVMKPGSAMSAASNTALDILNNGLFKLGLITDLNSPWQTSLWIQHGFFHHIGLVVHDVGSYGVLQPGMIITMEPGLYFPENYLAQRAGRIRNIDQKELDEFMKKVEPIFRKYINIGVRIEDDVLITETGNVVVTKEVPKEIVDIERLMKEKSFFNR